MPTINPLSALNNLGGASNSSATLANDFDTFLTLLTTQLQNQNPLEPLDTNQFTEQLVQYSEVEQAIQTNTNLENLIKLQAATAITNTVSYIGKTVELSGTSQPLKNGVANWPINSAADAPNATFTIKDSDGNVIFNETQAIAEGSSEYNWNGETNDGAVAPDGDYTLTIEATNTDGVGIQVNIASSGLVTGVDMSEDTIYLEIAGKKVKLEDITSIRQ